MRGPSVAADVEYRPPGRRAHLVGSPFAPALVAAVGGVVFVFGRWLIAAHRNLSAFIVLGSAHVTVGKLPEKLVVTTGSGYDGQFYYRMALDPADLSRSAFGIRLDTFSRLERIAYPAIAWLVAGGRSSLVPYALVITNVVALAALGLAGGLLARDSGRHPMWGVTLAAYWGYLWVLGRDLTEITTAAFLVLGLVALRKHRPVLAGLALLAAVLSKETAAYVVAMIAVTQLAGALRWRDRRSLGASDLAWALPLLGFAGWQLVVFDATGVEPLVGSGSANLGPPLMGLLDGLGHYVAALPSFSSVIWIGELAALATIAATAAVTVRRSSAPVHEKMAWFAVVALALCAARGIWLGDVGFRSLDDVYLLSWILLLGSRRDLRVLGVVVGIIWLLVAAELVRYV